MYHEAVPEHDFAALDSLQLLPRLLHAVSDPDLSLTLLGQRLSAPLLPLASAFGEAEGTLSVLGAETLLRYEGAFPAYLPLLKPEKMGLMMPKVRKLVARGVPGFVLDLSASAELPPFGNLEWHPRTREDLAELRAAAGVPVWLG